MTCHTKSRFRDRLPLLFHVTGGLPRCFRLPTFFRAMGAAMLLLGVTGAAWAISLPTSVSDSAVWLDAAQIPVQTDDTDLTLWSDQSAVGANDATQGTAAFAPHYIVAGPNGRPTVRFDGSNDYLNVASTSGLTSLGHTIFYVVDRNATQAQSLIRGRQLGAFGTEEGLTLEWGISAQYSNVIHEDSSGNAISIGSGAQPTSAFTLVTAIYNSNEVDIYHNGVDQGYTSSTQSGSTPLGAVNAAPLNLSIGAEPETFARNLNGDVSEIIVYNRELNAAERIIVGNYLNAKYNLDSATFGNDRYEGDLAANGDYDRDVLGVGRESLSDQLTASESAGLRIEVSGSLDDNGDYLLAGHKVETNSLTMADTPPGVGERWDRVWQLDVTDADDDLAVNLTFDFSEAGLTLPGGLLNEYFLLFSLTDPFSFSSIASGPSIDGDRLTFLLPAGQLVDGFYTLSFVQVPEPSTALLLGLGWMAIIGRRSPTNRRKCRPEQAVRSSGGRP